MHTHLPPTYEEARDRFTSAGAAFDFKLERIPLEGHHGPSGEDLSCDVALRRSGTARTAIVTTSAVHGVEGYAGTALQELWMSRDDCGDRVDMIHVHALNPHGYAHDRRADSSNTDINRNFQPMWPVQDQACRYADFARVIVPEQGSWIKDVMAEAKLICAMVKPGMETMKDIITRGQYSTPDGMYYGGDGPTWSRSVWEGIISRHLATYDRVIHIDIHTGLGDVGSLQVIGASGQDELSDLAKKAWGSQLAFMSATDGSNTSLSSVTTGGIENAWILVQQDKPQAASTYTFEFGTRPPLDVFRALRADHSAHAYGNADEARTRFIRSKMRDAFAPADKEWLSQVITQGNKAFSDLVSVL